MLKVIDILILIRLCLNISSTYIFLLDIMIRLEMKRREENIKLSRSYFAKSINFKIPQPSKIFSFSK